MQTEPFIFSELGIETFHLRGRDKSARKRKGQISWSDLGALTDWVAPSKYGSTAVIIVSVSIKFNWFSFWEVFTQSSMVTPYGLATQFGVSIFLLLAMDSLAMLWNWRKWEGDLIWLLSVYFPVQNISPLSCIYRKKKEWKKCSICIDNNSPWCFWTE